MPAYDKGDIQRRMHGAVEALKHDLGGRCRTVLGYPCKDTLEIGECRLAHEHPHTLKCSSRCRT